MKIRLTQINKHTFHLGQLIIMKLKVENRVLIITSTLQSDNGVYWWITFTMEISTVQGSTSKWSLSSIQVTQLYNYHSQCTKESWFRWGNMKKQYIHKLLMANKFLLLESNAKNYMIVWQQLNFNFREQRSRLDQEDIYTILRVKHQIASSEYNLFQILQINLGWELSSSEISILV